MQKTSQIQSLKADADSSDFSKLLEQINGSIGSQLSSIQMKYSKHKAQQMAPIAFVSPILPHHCELEIWNLFLKKIGNTGIIYTNKNEENNFNSFCETFKIANENLLLGCKYLSGMPDNKLFLSGLEHELKSSEIIISVGENSLSSYQSLKAKRQYQNRLIIWQNSPRPLYTSYLSNAHNNSLTPSLAREKTIRKEILKNCDILVCFDKESASWAYLEEVDSQRLRKISRGLNPKVFNDEININKRFSLRKNLNLPETDFIFLQLGPLEVETGCLDSIYAFKNLLLSNPNFVGQVKLCFCGTGSAATDVRQTVVELELDNDVYFINPHSQDIKQTIGNQLANLVSLCDAVIHNPIHPVNSVPTKLLDCTYDILCALASGITIISNAHGWIGEWVARFYKTFSPSNIYSQARLMQQSIEKQDKLNPIKSAIKKSLLNEFSIENASNDLAKIVKSLLISEIVTDYKDITPLIEQIDKMVCSHRYLDAIQSISQAFTNKNLPPTHQAALFRLISDCFTKLGDMENGFINYHKAIELDPYCAKSYIGLGTIALQQSQYQLAVPNFHKAVALSPKSDLANLGLGLAFDWLGEKQEALHWTSRACTLNIHNTAAIFNLVKISYELEQYQEAQSVLQQYVDLHPNDVNMIYSLAGISFKMGALDEAVRLLENILTLDPMNSRAHSLLKETANLVTEQKRKA
ncbi:MAG: tetratricopeptide repeat protein [Silvanigrellaceae bacterium]|nr:tetratricopeptide repeat protein [Silvanigrellaceae bacterium]